MNCTDYNARPVIVARTQDDKLQICDENGADCKPYDKDVSVEIPASREIKYTVKPIQQGDKSAVAVCTDKKGECFTADTHEVDTESGHRTLTAHEGKLNSCDDNNVCMSLDSYQYSQAQYGSVDLCEVKEGGLYGENNSYVGDLIQPQSGAGGVKLVSESPYQGETLYTCAEDQGQHLIATLDQADGYVFSGLKGVTFSAEVIKKLRQKFEIPAGNLFLASNGFKEGAACLKPNLTLYEAWLGRLKEDCPADLSSECSALMYAIEKAHPDNTWKDTGLAILIFVAGGFLVHLLAGRGKSNGSGDGFSGRQLQEIRDIAGHQVASALIATAEEDGEVVASEEAATPAVAATTPETAPSQAATEGNAAYGSYTDPQGRQTTFQDGVRTRSEGGRAVEVSTARPQGLGPATQQAIEIARARKAAAGSPFSQLMVAAQAKSSSPQAVAAPSVELNAAAISTPSAHLGVVAPVSVSLPQMPSLASLRIFVTPVVPVPVGAR